MTEQRCFQDYAELCPRKLQFMSIKLDLGLECFILAFWKFFHIIRL